MSFRTLDNLDVAGKRVLLRADLNVPVRDGKITDLTRIERLSPTIRELIGKQAKVIVCSHFDRPKGKRVASMSLAPMAAALGEVLGRRVRFVEDCTGPAAEQAVSAFWTALKGNDPAAAAQTVPPAQRSCTSSLLSAGPKITVTSFAIVSAQPAGNLRATVRFTVQAHATLDGTTVPVLPQGPGSQQWLITTEQAGHWYVDLAGSGDLAFSGACS